MCLGGAADGCGDSGHWQMKNILKKERCRWWRKEIDGIGVRTFLTLESGVNARGSPNRSSAHRP